MKEKIVQMIDELYGPADLMEVANYALKRNRELMKEQDQLEREGVSARRIGELNSTQPRDDERAESEGHSFSRRSPRENWRYQ